MAFFHMFTFALFYLEPTNLLTDLIILIIIGFLCKKPQNHDNVTTIGQHSLAIGLSRIMVIQH